MRGLLSRLHSNSRGIYQFTIHFVIIIKTESVKFDHNYKVLSKSIRGAPPTQPTQSVTQDSITNFHLPILMNFKFVFKIPWHLSTISNGLDEARPEKSSNIYRWIVEIKYLKNCFLKSYRRSEGTHALIKYWRNWNERIGEIERRLSSYTNGAIENE